MRFLSQLLIFMLVCQNAWAGLPPTTTQGQSDASAKTKFAFQAPFSQVTDLGGIKALFESGNQNLLSNANMQGVYTANLAQGWTLSTATAVKDTTNFIDGNVSQQVSVTAQTGELSQDVTPTIQTNGVPMVSACMVKTTGTDVQVCARTNATDITCSTVASNGNWVLQPVNFTGPANGTSVGVSVKNTASSTETYNVGKCYVGVSSTPQNFGQVSQGSLIAYGVWTQAAGCSWTTPTTSGAPTDFSANASCNNPSVFGIASAPGTKVPQLPITNLPPGDYRIVAVGALSEASTGTVANLYFNLASTVSDANGKTVSGRIKLTAASSNIAPMLEGHFTFTQAQSSVTFKIQAASDNDANEPVIYDLNSTEEFSIYVYRTPLSSEISSRTDILPSSWSGTQVGSGGGWSTASGVYADFSVATTSNTLTQLTNTNFGTVVAEATKLPAITMTPTKPGSYWICASGTASNTTATDSADIRMVDGSSNVINGGVFATISGSNSWAPFTVCGIDSLASTSSVTIKLQGSASAGTASIVQNSSAPITWSITALNQQIPSPLLMGSVTSTSAGQEHIERARIANNGAATVTSQSASPAWTVNRSALGVVDITFNTTWTTIPMCTCSAEIAGRTCALTSLTTTTAQVQTLNTSAINEDRNFSIICMGPR